MFSSHKHLLRWSLALAALGSATPANAGQTVAAPNGGPWHAMRQALGDVAEQGEWDLYLSGYAYHSRETYSSRRIATLNEKAWGIGVGKTLHNPRGNDESLYLLAIRDSRNNIQLSAGYAYQWMFPVGRNGLAVGAGLSAALIRREDWFGGVPFPALLPVFSAGNQKVMLNGAYVPRISSKKGKGDVLLMFVKFAF